MKKQILITVVIALIVGGGAFWGGMVYGQNKSTLPARGEMMQFQGFQNGNGAQSAIQRNAQGGSFVSGIILEKDDRAVTIALPGGGSRIVFYSQSTNISKTATGSADDLVKNGHISVAGTSNSDGSITAKSIQMGTGGVSRSNQNQN